MDLGISLYLLRITAYLATCWVGIFSNGFHSLQIDLAARAALSAENGSSDIVSLSNHIGSFYPFTHWRTQTKVPPLLINSSLNLSNDDTLLDTQSVITVADF